MTTDLHVPAFQIDPRALPQPILTPDPASFAHNTFKVRLPRIILDTIEANEFPRQISDNLLHLRQEILEGHIRRFTEQTSDRSLWDESVAPQIGRAWLDVPWYWAEAYLYRRILEATRYFQTGEWFGVDSYRMKKMEELAPGAAPELLKSLLEDLPKDAESRLETLIHPSLWGNRTDLSYNVGGDIERHHSVLDERENLLVINAPRIWKYLRSAKPRRIGFIADNAATELLMDFALIDFLLDNWRVLSIVLYLKAKPFFVSDAMQADVWDGLAALNAEPLLDLAQRFRGYLSTSRLALRSHWFFTTSLFYFQLPQDLCKELGELDLVVLKGEVNYRPLLGDAHWNPTTPFEQATAYFPRRVAALWTLKTELIVGLEPGEAERISQQDPRWTTNG